MAEALFLNGNPLSHQRDKSAWFNDFQILLSILQTLQLVLFLCKLRLSSFLFGSEFNGFRSKQAGFFAIIFETV